MKRVILLIALLLTACRQEITTGLEGPIPAPPTLESTPTEVVTATLPPATAVPTRTPTPVTFPPAQALPAGPVSMIAIGDSLTQGDGDDSGRGYPGRVLEQVVQERPGSTMTNFAQSGWTSDALIHGDQGMFGQLERAAAEVDAALSQGRGAVVFIWIGSNDLWYLYEYGGVTAEQEEQDAERFAANMDTILIALRGKGAQVIVALLDDQSKRPAALAGEAFTGITPGELARMSSQVVRYNGVIQQKAEQYGALTVDFYNSDIFTNPATLSDDGNHPNQAGYDLIAQKWLEALALLMPGG
ncbi:MAG: hypothetical protein DPW18_06950 [Chloroflexi bacterium]|nr:hypothetical protein [Chloroflexota bacterium]MDL1941553.1 hypothetical protein [Chloroflexi bacterium CFX2]